MNRPSFRSAILACLALLAAMTAGAAAEQTPKAFLEKLYANYVGPHRNGLRYDSDKAMAGYLSPGVITLMDKMYAAARKADEVPALDGDPFVDAQEWDIKGFDIAVDQAGDDKATGHVRFRNLGEDKSITLDLVRVKAGWRIDDIHYSDGTLRKLLATPEPN